ncbi:uncharacterized protein PITG_01560 [Phytophthora infestans T30-4]|uniref:DNL-type domain-containing protein n=1 Tax=Phytophthora infestans (strain T30-4) TaxID=403677 RepID=D0MTJ2_PHYIT|nr:uncharacterized protein PITG_01560 [Phytophthora infestans T30-4]EEY61289.1 conserved hypothetical protein [Phytophthora infestans T30-4]KAI9993943.1 hypothetical protein PInf_016465 [Phytophthora infestans]|eukprot:XP_002908206.1 conserved hypothetical protein [Phytophthora infestans T30-4]
MWRRALVRCAPAVSSSQALRRICVDSSSASPPLLISSASFQHLHRHDRCFVTESGNDDSAPVSPAISSESTASATECSSAPGVESPGEKFVMIYTCSVCETRSAKTISKHAYYNGVVLVRCPGCENQHLVADRLGWFEDDSVDVESLLKHKGESVRFVTAENVLELTENDILGGKNEK